MGRIMRFLGLEKRDAQAAAVDQAVAEAEVRKAQEAYDAATTP